LTPNSSLYAKKNQFFGFFYHDSGNSQKNRKRGKNYKFQNYDNYRIMKEIKRRKCNRYLTSIPIESREEAMVLASEVCWDIIQVLLEFGVAGMTPQEIRGELKTKGYPQSTVYAALAQLERAGWISSSRRRLPWGRPSREILDRIGRYKAKGGRPRKFYRAHILWEFGMDDAFAESLDPIVEKYIPELEEVWMNTLGKIVEEFRTKEDLQKFYPKEVICPDCDASHEGIEFLRAISYGVVHFMEARNKWRDFAKKHAILSMQY